jgi:hypothetical protein
MRLEYASEKASIFMDTTIGVAGSPQTLTVTGDTTLQTVTCGALTCTSLSVSGGELRNFVSYVAQSPTSAQQTVARTNIGAVSTTDTRLTDARTPIVGSVVDASVSASAAIQQSKIAGLTSDLAARVLKAGDTMTGQLNGTKGVFSDDLQVIRGLGPKSVILEGDARLTDSRIPIEGSVVDASVSASAGIQQSKIANLVTDLSNKLSTNSPGSQTVTGTVNFHTVNVTGGNFVASGI